MGKHPYLFRDTQPCAFCDSGVGVTSDWSASGAELSTCEKPVQLRVALHRKDVISHGKYWFLVGIMSCLVLLFLSCFFLTFLFLVCLFYHCLLLFGVFALFCCNPCMSTHKTQIAIELHEFYQEIDVNTLHLETSLCFAAMSVSGCLTMPHPSTMIRSRGPRRPLLRQTEPSSYSVLQLDTGPMARGS